MRKPESAVAAENDHRETRATRIYDGRLRTLDRRNRDCFIQADPGAVGVGVWNVGASQETEFLVILSRLWEFAAAVDVAIQTRSDQYEIAGRSVLDALSDRPTRASATSAIWTIDAVVGHAPGDAGMRLTALLAFGATVLR